MLSKVMRSLFYFHPGLYAETIENGVRSLIIISKCIDL